MRTLFNQLKTNKIFKIVIALIVVFFLLLSYFNKSKAVNDCTCNEWDCYDDCSQIWPYPCTQHCTCVGNDSCEGECPSTYYVCNRQTNEGGGVGCCPIILPTPTPPTDGGGCDPNSWTACSVTCGGGSKANDCGSTVACNEQPCCTPSCGGIECGNLAAAPNKVTNVQVNGNLSGNLDLTSSSNLNIIWIDPGVSDPTSAITNYVIQVWDKTQGTTPPYPCNEASNCSYYDTVTKTENYTTTASADHDNDVYVAVRAINNTCVSVGYGSWSDSSSYNLVANVTGNFYEDQSETPDAFNNCNSTSTTAVDLSSYAGSSVTSSIGGTSGGLGTSYSLSNVPYAPSSSWNNYGFDISLAIDNSSDPLNSITCTCPVDLNDPFLCKHTNTTSPATNQHIYLTNINLSNGPWWQTMGGLVYSKEIFATTIPDTCELSALCDAYIITQNSSGDSSSAGIPLTGVSQISQGDGGYSERDFDPRAVNTDHDNLIKENYAYFNRGVDLLSADTGEISDTITSIPTTATPDSDDTEVYYSNGDLTIELTSTQTIASTRKVVIFVDGNLTFSSTPDTQMIDVTQGGFIAFIASGNITFDALVGNTDETSIAPNIAGVFIADGTINVNGYSDTEPYDDDRKDNKFVGEGTFVGWTGFNLNRDYENDSNPLQKELNNLNPTEVFIFRPDFNKNIPAIMMQPSLVWQEVN